MDDMTKRLPGRPSGSKNKAKKDPQPLKKDLRSHKRPIKEFSSDDDDEEYDISTIRVRVSPSKKSKVEGKARVLKKDQLKDGEGEQWLNRRAEHRKVLENFKNDLREFAQHLLRKDEERDQVFLKWLHTVKDAVECDPEKSHALFPKVIPTYFFQLSSYW